MYNGIINVYKEKGYTSHDVVAKLRGICKQKKIGHTGTLDPEAEGVLPVCLGKATKLCDLLTDKDKTYEACLLLGVETDTQDMTGSVLHTSPVEVTKEQVETAIYRFVGNYQQIPPMYSALKVNGKKLYEYARAGIQVERNAREVIIYGISIQKIELPRVWFQVECSKGTYIRTLCHDIGQSLHTGGVMESLVRKKAGVFRIEDSLKLEEIERLRNEGKLERVLFPLDSMFSQVEKAVVHTSYSKILYNGNGLWPQCLLTEPKDEELRIYDEAGHFIGIYQWEETKGQYQPKKLFLPIEENDK